MPSLYEVKNAKTRKVAHPPDHWKGGIMLRPFSGRDGGFKRFKGEFGHTSLELLKLQSAQNSTRVNQKQFVVEFVQAHRVTKKSLFFLGKLGEMHAKEYVAWNARRTKSYT